MGQMLTVQEVADRLRVTPLTVRRWINAGDLAAVKLGGDKAGWRIEEVDLVAFLDQRKFGAVETGKAAA
jgi:excisionase family DNA binding protein